ncbi:MAG: endonuclease/exonuclease/phosphatase family protein, partial [Pseudomonadota bacterium]
MALYWKLRTINNLAHRAHVSRRVRELRDLMRTEVTARTSEHDLRLATWNLMHFGGGGAYWRGTDALLYIAEIIDHFDLVAIQEVKEDLTQLDELVRHFLGPEWDYIVTDTTGGDLGNEERMAFLYRKGKVRFAKLAGEIVLPEGQTIVGAADTPFDEQFQRHAQFARSPFIVGFECGWFNFKLCTVHIYYGKAPDRPAGFTDAQFRDLKKDVMEIRRTEIQEIASFLADRQKRERRTELRRLKDKGWDTEQSKA